MKPYSDAFLRWWAAYACPRRVRKPEAWAEWQRQGCEGEADTVVAGLEAFKRTRQWTEGYMPEAARWLKQRRWEDEPVELPPAPGGDDW